MLTYPGQFIIVEMVSKRTRVTGTVNNESMLLTEVNSFIAELTADAVSWSQLLIFKAQDAQATAKVAIIQA